MAIAASRVRCGRRCCVGGMARLFPQAGGPKRIQPSPGAMLRMKGSEPRAHAHTLRNAVAALVGFARRHAIFRGGRIESAVGGGRRSRGAVVADRLADRMLGDVCAALDLRRLSHVASSRRRRHVRVGQTRLRAVRRILYRLDVLGVEPPVLSGSALLRCRQRALRRRQRRQRLRRRRGTSSRLRSSGSRSQRC